MSGVPAAPPPPPPVGWGLPPFNLGQWLASMDMAQYQAEFEANGFDRLDALFEMTTQDMEGLGVKKGHIKVIEGAIKNLQASGPMFPPHRGSFMGPPGAPPMPLPPHRPSLAPMPIAPPPPHGGVESGDGEESKDEGKAEGQPAKKKRNRIPGKVSLAKGNMPPMRMVQPINMPRPPPFYPFAMPLPPVQAKPITTVDGKPLAPKKVDTPAPAEPVKERKKPGRKPKKPVEAPKEDEKNEGEEAKEGDEDKKEEGADTKEGEDGVEGEVAEKPEKKRKKADDGNGKPAKKQSIAAPPPAMPQFPYAYAYPGPYPGYPPYPGPPPPGAEGYPYPGPYGPPGGQPMFPMWGPPPSSQPPPPPGGNGAPFAPRMSIPTLPKPPINSKAPRPIATRPLAVAQAFGIPPVLLEKKEKEGSDVEKPKKVTKRKAPEEKEREAAEKEARKEARAAAQERKKAERAARKSEKAKDKAAKAVKAAESEAEKIDSAPMPVVSEGEQEAPKQEHVEDVAVVAVEEVKETKKGGKKRKNAEGEGAEPAAKKGRGSRKAAAKPEDDEDDKPLKTTAKADKEDPDAVEEAKEEGGEDVVCSLCGIGEDDPELGELDGPHGFDKEKQEIWVHEDCAMWSPEFYIDPEKGEPMGLDKIVNRGRSLRCSHCRQPGATIGCKEPACRRTFHFKCIVPSGGTKREEDYFVYCSEHKESMNKPKDAATGKKSARSSAKQSSKTAPQAAKTSSPAPAKSPAPKRKASAAAVAASPAPVPARKGSLRSADRKPRNAKK